jgi:cytochrome bd-type quinol oxidase subunit 2
MIFEKDGKHYLKSQYIYGIGLGIAIISVPLINPEDVFEWIIVAIGLVVILANLIWASDEELNNNKNQELEVVQGITASSVILVGAVLAPILADNKAEGYPRHATLIAFGIGIGFLSALPYRLPTNLDSTSSLVIERHIKTILITYSAILLVIGVVGLLRGQANLPPEE